MATQAILEAHYKLYKSLDDTLTNQIEYSKY